MPIFLLVLKLPKGREERGKEVVRLRVRESMGRGAILNRS